MEEYLFNVSKVRRDEFIGQDTIDESLACMDEYIRNSTRFHFQDNHFFRELPEILKQKLTKSVLYR